MKKDNNVSADNIYKLDVIHNKENTHSKVINHGLNFTSSKLEFIINFIDF